MNTRSCYQGGGASGIALIEVLFKHGAGVISPDVQLLTALSCSAGAKLVRVSATEYRGSIQHLSAFTSIKVLTVDVDDSLSVLQQKDNSQSKSTPQLSSLCLRSSLRSARFCVDVFKTLAPFRKLQSLTIDLSGTSRYKQDNGLDVDEGVTHSWVRAILEDPSLTCVQELNIHGIPVDVATSVLSQVLRVRVFPNLQSLSVGLPNIHPMQQSTRNPVHASFWSAVTTHRLPRLNSVHVYGSLSSSTDFKGDLLYWPLVTSFYISRQVDALATSIYLLQQEEPCLRELGATILQNVHTWSLVDIKRTNLLLSGVNRLHGPCKAAATARLVGLSPSLPVIKLANEVLTACTSTFSSDTESTRVFLCGLSDVRHCIWPCVKVTLDTRSNEVLNAEAAIRLCLKVLNTRPALYDSTSRKKIAKCLVTLVDARSRRRNYSPNVGLTGFLSVEQLNEIGLAVLRENPPTDWSIATVLDYIRWAVPTFITSCVSAGLAVRLTAALVDHLHSALVDCHDLHVYAGAVVANDRKKALSLFTRLNREGTLFRFVSSLLRISKSGNSYFTTSSLWSSMCCPELVSAFGTSYIFKLTSVASDIGAHRPPAPACVHEDLSKQFLNTSHTLYSTAEDKWYCYTVLAVYGTWGRYFKEVNRKFEKEVKFTDDPVKRKDLVVQALLAYAHADTAMQVDSYNTTSLYRGHFAKKAGRNILLEVASAVRTRPTLEEMIVIGLAEIAKVSPELGIARFIQRALASHGLEKEKYHDIVTVVIALLQKYAHNKAVAQLLRGIF